MITTTPATTTGERSDGFTLIELLIVIVILGILATVVVVSVQGIVDRGERSSIDSDAATITKAEEAHMAEHGTYADENTLVAANLLRAPSQLHDITLINGGTDYQVIKVADPGSISAGAPRPGG